MPEPSPASAAGTSAMAIVSRGMNALPIPRPMAKKARKMVGKKLGVRAAVVSRPRPAIDREHARDEHAHRRRSARPGGR